MAGTRAFARWHWPNPSGAGGTKTLTPLRGESRVTESHSGEANNLDPTEVHGGGNPRATGVIVTAQSLSSGRYAEGARNAHSWPLRAGDWSRLSTSLPPWHNVLNPVNLLVRVVHQTWRDPEADTSRPAQPSAITRTGSGAGQKVPPRGPRGLPLTSSALSRAIQPCRVCGKASQSAAADPTPWAGARRASCQGPLARRRTGGSPAKTIPVGMALHLAWLPPPSFGGRVSLALAACGDEEGNAVDLVVDGAPGGSPPHHLGQGILPGLTVPRAEVRPPRTEMTPSPWLGGP